MTDDELVRKKTTFANISITRSELFLLNKKRLCYEYVGAIAESCPRVCVLVRFCPSLSRRPAVLYGRLSGAGRAAATESLSS